MYLTHGITPMVMMLINITYNSQALMQEAWMLRLTIYNDDTLQIFS